MAGGSRLVAERMADVPAACEDFDARVRAIEDEIEDLRDQRAGVGLPPNEPPLNAAQKAAITLQISRLEGNLHAARHVLDECVRANTPAPPPTTPQLGAAVEVVQSIQTFGNGIRLVLNKPTAVRVFVTSGVSNRFDAGAGPNRWPNVTGELLITDPATGARRVCGTPSRRLVPLTSPRKARERHGVRILSRTTEKPAKQLLDPEPTKLTDHKPS